MKSILRIKWENLLLVILIGTTIYGWVVYLKYATEIKMLLMMLIATILCLVMLFGYKSIAAFRKQIIKFW